VKRLALFLVMAIGSISGAAEGTTSSAVLGGGCFWCLEAVYERLPGVLAVTSGYAGGHTTSPTYEEVCSGSTGHAEVVKIEFDPARISYEKLLELFWQAHDPTTLNRQGADVGTQYRSIVLALDDTQLEAARAAIAKAQPEFDTPIVTEIAKLDTFYPAEEEHQDFFRNNPGHPYNRAVVAPKLRKLDNK
jgi:peptide-methionine (S)-S-oxide reductase